jgi:hypothetical protein
LSSILVSISRLKMKGLHNQSIWVTACGLWEQYLWTRP